MLFLIGWYEFPLLLGLCSEYATNIIVSCPYCTAGSLSSVDEAAAAAPAPAPAADGSAGLPAAFKPLRPAKDVLQERSANLTDAWARTYLARGCAAVVHAGGGEDGSGRGVLVGLGARVGAWIKM